jgi:hypothetical protein
LIKQRLAGVPLCLLLAILLASAACGDASSPSESVVTPGATARTEIRIGALTVQAEIAQTPEERGQGLSGRPSLSQEAGMLFVYSEERIPSFWMLDMRFALDFIWISADLRVADLTEDVPPPEPGESDLPRYGPDQPILYVLEVNAGVVQEAGVQVGDTVAFDPGIPAEDAP